MEFYNNKDLVLIKSEFLTVQVIKGIVVEREEKALFTDICYKNWLSKQEKPVVKVV